ncbi:hypothetical protein [Algoriphagus sediminis]|uniref:Outer membrane protein beta-barrel domain-containing protein n=1 Tax=Algoriphagus sediminis TaxID=3057113 RepID=A0ABT7YCB8_9BACT|nr:hypothetical protein [Algoriphagus sediminis]MDN3204167.1 hypothetical protein [Algoriphagus sediminis]
MKRICVILCLILIGSFSHAQEAKPNETVFNEGFGKSVGVMGAIGLGPAQWGESAVGLLNMRAGAVFKDKVSIGGFYNSSLNDFRGEFVGAQGPAMDFRWFGGFFEYTLFADRKFHLTFPVLIGGAEVDRDEQIPGTDENFEANFFLVEPSALLEINLLQNLRFNIGFGYRFAGDFAFSGIDQSEISGFSAQAGLKFGLFRK